MDAYKSFGEIPSQSRQPADSIEYRRKVQLRGSRKESPESARAREKTKTYIPNPREPVIGSETGYKAVDRVALRVVAPASEYCKPPPPPPKFIMAKQGTVAESDFTAKDKFPIQPGRIRTTKGLTEDGHVEELLNMQDVAVVAADAHMKTVKDGVTASQELVNKAQDVIATIDYLANQMEGPYNEFADFVKKALAEVREQRIALGMETRQLMTALKEVRQFFLDGDHAQQVKRLHEFVEICERLRALKEDGTLDAIADTMLKL
jgi:hypothetical protein